METIKLPCSINEKAYIIIQIGTSYGIVETKVKEIIIRENYFVITFKNTARIIRFNINGEIIERDWKIYLENEKELAEKELEKLNNSKVN